MLGMGLHVHPKNYLTYLHALSKYSPGDILMENSHAFLSSVAFYLVSFLTLLYGTYTD